MLSFSVVYSRLTAFLFVYKPFDSTTVELYTIDNSYTMKGLLPIWFCLLKKIINNNNSRLGTGEIVVRVDVPSRPKWYSKYSSTVQYKSKRKQSHSIYLSSLRQ